MKYVASLAPVFLCAAALTMCASGQSLRGGMKLQPVPVYKAPPLYTPAQRAVALAKALNTTTPMSLGTSISVTPGRPVVPSAAGLIMTDVQSYGATPDNPDGTVVFHKSTAAAVYLDLHVAKDKRYAVDCRTSAPRVFYSYPMGAGRLDGEAATDTNSHVVFATSAMPADQQVLVGFTFASKTFMPETKVLSFWGCEVAPF